LMVGDSDFAGRLPLTFPRSTAQLPRAQPADPARPVTYPERADAGYRWFAQRSETPLFPFGFGLGYAGVTYDNAHFTGGARPQVSVTLHNRAARATTAVPQLYLVGPERAPARLVGWLSADLAPGAVRRITIAADARLLARHRQGRWSMAPGDYRFTLGNDAQHVIASAIVRINTTPNSIPRKRR